MTQLDDFRFVAVKISNARHIAGFGTARSIDDEEVRRALGPKRNQPRLADQGLIVNRLHGHDSPL